MLIHTQKWLGCALFCWCCCTANAESVFSQDFQSSSAAVDYSTTNNPAQNQFSGTAGSLIGSTGTNQYLSLSGAGNRGFWRAGIVPGNDLTGAPLISMKYTMDVNFSGYTNTTGFSFVIGSGFANGVGTAAATAGQEIFGRLTFRGGASGLWSVTNGVSGTNGTYFGWQTVSLFLNDSGGNLNYLAPNGSMQTLANRQWDAWIGAVQEVDGAPAEEPAATLSNMKMGIGSTVAGTFDIDNIRIEPAAYPSLSLFMIH